VVGQGGGQGPPLALPCGRPWLGLCKSKGCFEKLFYKIERYGRRHIFTDAMLTLKAEYAAITVQQIVVANISFLRKRETTTSNLEMTTTAVISVETKPANRSKSLVTLSRSV